MEEKYCPLSFFSFFVNKKSAQGGGCHKCLGHECGWYDEYQTEYGEVVGQCGVMTMFDSFRNIGESLASMAINLEPDDKDFFKTAVKRQDHPEQDLVSSRKMVFPKDLDHSLAPEPANVSAPITPTAPEIPATQNSADPIVPENSATSQQNLNNIFNKLRKLPVVGQTTVTAAPEPPPLAPSPTLPSMEVNPI